MKIFNNMFVVILLAIALHYSWHYTLKVYDKRTFRFFNYQVLIMNDHVSFYDRVKTIDIRVNKLEKK